GVSRRHAFLVAEDFRPHVSRKLGKAGRSDRLYRFQLDLLSSVHSRLLGNASPLLAISSRIPGLERALHRRFDHSGGRVPSSDDLFLVVDALRQTRRSEPLGRSRFGMDDAFAASNF